MLRRATRHRNVSFIHNPGRAHTHTPTAARESDESRMRRAESLLARPTTAKGKTARSFSVPHRLPFREVKLCSARSRSAHTGTGKNTQQSGEEKKSGEKRKTEKAELFLSLFSFVISDK